MKLKLSTVHEAYQQMVKYFKGDKIKALEWFQTPIYQFQYRSPTKMIKAGREKVVIEYVNELIKGYS